MRQYRSRSSTWTLALLTATSLCSHQLFAQDTDTTPPATPAQEQPEVLGRGPIHEAFAEPVTMQIQAGLVVPQQPPPNIEEIPSAEKPQGQQFVWIPGYWAWDADRLGYIWVSACWRAAPPNMSWTPGYWVQVSGGWEWVAGFWAPAGVRNIAYLPPPPVIEDLEPVSVQISSDMIWVPPCMYWSEEHYIRRAGYWLKAQPNWVWVPAHYVTTPRGYIFAEGHWDYSLERRGVLFAPVYFPASVYGRVGFTFTPGIVIDMGLLQVSLFAYPRYSHYYFGDYYDGTYLRIGIFPWFESHRHHTWYDPIYEHARWRNRAEPRWEEHTRDEYRRRHDDKDLRPAHTFREQESRTARLPEPQRHTSQLVRPMESVVTSQKTSMKLERTDPGTRQKMSKQATEVHTFSNERRNWESSVPDRKNVQPIEEQKPTLTQPSERKKTVQPIETRKPATLPSTEHRQTVQPIEEHKPTLTQPSERKKPVQPIETRKPATLPSTEHRQAVHSPERSESPVAAPVSQQISVPSPVHETRSVRPERVQIPASPVVGNSGRSGFFRKGPPTQPDDETKKRSFE
ncbi:MAG: hypothetical protein HOO88_00715 [Kiritimatiellaceae bacterium]|nr:hypothetical protein [Kiritimatiellaceae bacterium]